MMVLTPEAQSSAALILTLRDRRRASAWKGDCDERAKPPEGRVG